MPFYVTKASYDYLPPPHERAVGDSARVSGRDCGFSGVAWLLCLFEKDTVLGVNLVTEYGLKENDTDQERRLLNRGSKQEADDARNSALVETRSSPVTVC